MVEATAAGARGMHEHAVEGLVPALVGVEALVEEVAQEAPGLRHAEGHPEPRGEEALRVVLGVRDDVADGGETETAHDRVARAVHELVDLAGLEAARHGDVPRVLHDASVHLTSEAPVAALHHRTGREPAVAHREDVVAVVGVGQRVRNVAAVAERERPHRPVHREVAPHEAFDGTVAIARDRRFEPQEARLARHVELPADPDDGQSQPHQEPVAQLGLARRVVAPIRAVEVRERGLATTVADLDERHARPRHALRAQDHEGRARLDESGGVPRGALEVHDATVGAIRGIEGEVDHAGELLVSAGGAERAPAEEVHARLDRDVPDLGAREGGSRQHADGEQDRERQRAPSGFRHRRCWCAWQESNLRPSD